MAEILHRNDFESLIQEREKISFKDEQWLFEQSMTLNKSLYNELAVKDQTGVVVSTVEGTFKQVSALKIAVQTAGYMVFVAPMHVAGEGLDALLTCEFRITYKPGALVSKEENANG